MRGIVASALSPSASGSTGTSRHSSGSSPSARHASSIASRADSSRRKTIATPGLPGRERQQHARAVARSSRRPR